MRSLGGLILACALAANSTNPPTLYPAIGYTGSGSVAWQIPVGAAATDSVRARFLPVTTGAHQQTQSITHVFDTSSGSGIFFLGCAMSVPAGSDWIGDVLTCQASMICT
jgi:hypothetical protein